jgi:hypothetical protein
MNRARVVAIQQEPEDIAISFLFGLGRRVRRRATRIAMWFLRRMVRIFRRR